MLEQYVGNVLWRVGEFDKTHHEGVLVLVIADGLLNLGPIPRQYAMSNGWDAVGEHAACCLAEVGL